MKAFGNLPAMPGHPTVQIHAEQLERFRLQFETLLAFAAQALGKPKETLAVEDVLEEGAKREFLEKRKPFSRHARDRALSIPTIGRRQREWIEAHRGDALVVDVATGIAREAISVSPMWEEYESEVAFWRAVQELNELLRYFDDFVGEGFPWDGGP